MLNYMTISLEAFLQIVKIVIVTTQVNLKIIQQ